MIDKTHVDRKLHRTPKPNSDSDFDGVGVGIAETKFFGVGVEKQFFAKSELESESEKKLFSGS